MQGGVGTGDVVKPREEGGAGSSRMLPVSGGLPVAEPAIRSVQERVVSPGGQGP